jgi:hypothetical protein
MAIRAGVVVIVLWKSAEESYHCKRNGWRQERTLPQQQESNVNTIGGGYISSFTINDQTKK